MKTLKNKFAILVVGLLAFSSCSKEDDVNPTNTNTTVDITNPSTLTDSLMINGATKVLGSIPSSTTSSSLQLTPTSTLSVASGGTLKLPLDGDVSNIDGVYLQVSGADSYLSTTKTVENARIASSSSDTVEVVIPYTYTNGNSFVLQYAVYKGSTIGNKVMTTVNVEAQPNNNNGNNNNNNGNNAPVTVADNVNLNIGQDYLLDVTQNDTDADNDNLTLVSVSSLGSDTATVSIVNGKVLVDFPSNSLFVGEVTLTYQVTDGTTTVSGTYTLDVGTVSQKQTVNFLDDFYGVTMNGQGGAGGFVFNSDGTVTQTGNGVLGSADKNVNWSVNTNGTVKLSDNTGSIDVSVTSYTFSNTYNGYTITILPAGVSTYNYFQM